MQFTWALVACEGAKSSPALKMSLGDAAALVPARGHETWKKNRPFSAPLEVNWLEFVDCDTQMTLFLRRVTLSPACVTVHVTLQD
jgi:hypothetical protein